MADARDQIDRPTPATLIAGAAHDLLGRTRRDEVRIRRHWLRVLAWMLGQTHHDLLGFLRWCIAQILPDQAEEDRLDAHANLYALSRAVATLATCTTLRFTGAPGTMVPIGTTVDRADGWTYETTAGGVVGAGGTLDLAATSQSSGADGNLDAGASLAIVPAVIGLTAAETIDGFSGGSDIESDADLRARVLARVREETEGGSRADYQTWVRAAVPETTAVWVGFPEDMALNVRWIVFCVNDGTGGQTPSAAQLTAARAYVEARRPVTALATVQAAIESPLALTIELEPVAWPSPTDTSTIRAAIEAELDALFVRIAGIRGSDGTMTIVNSEIRNAIGRAAQVFALTAVGGGGGFDDVAVGLNVVVVRGVITWS